MGFTDIRDLHTSPDPGMDLTVRQEEEELEKNVFSYTRVDRKLMVLARLTRLDISISAREVSRSISLTQMRHWRGL